MEFPLAINPVHKNPMASGQPCVQSHGQCPLRRAMFPPASCSQALVSHSFVLLSQELDVNAGSVRSRWAAGNRIPNLAVIYMAVLITSLLQKLVQ